MYCRTNFNRLAALRAARDFQEGHGPLPPYSVIRILEKKKLVVVYQKLHEETDYPTPTKRAPDRTSRRPTIYALILTYQGLLELGIEKSPRPRSVWDLD